MSLLPVFIIEEHHEAFFIWHEAVHRGLLSPANRNVLLHVDRHADMKAHYLRAPIPPLSSPVKAVKDFTYQELLISSFIIPAVYQKLFYEVCWLVPSGLLEESANGTRKGEKQYYYVRTENADRRSFVVRRDPLEGFSDRPWEDRSPFCFYHQTTAESFSPDSTVALDIDLDYFCGSETTDVFERIEITADEYERCRTERYRKLNLHYRRYLEIDNGRYYLCFSPLSPSAGPARRGNSEEEILASLRDFRRFLERNRVSPAFIDICRSRFSGYTPEPVWQFIEEKLLEELGRLYELEISYLPGESGTRL
jgi:hypothetical protein